jgi:hypothetical protein
MGSLTAACSPPDQEPNQMDITVLINAQNNNRLAEVEPPGNGAAMSVRSSP